MAQLFGVDHDELRQAYDDACRELAAACREINRMCAPAARSREPLEGMLVLDIESSDADAVPSFTELQRRSA